MKKTKKDELAELLTDCGTLYPFETLINGNVKECINTLKAMAEHAPVFLHENLKAIEQNEQTRDKYNYIVKQLKNI